MADPNQSQEIINRAALKAAGLGIPGSFFPPLDMAGMAFIWIKLMKDLAKASGHKINFYLATKFILSVTSGASFYLGGSKLLNALLHAIPGAGTVTAASTNAAFNWIYTLRLGKLLASQFNQPTFDSRTLIVSASGIASLMFAIPTSDEVSDAFHTIGDVIGWHADAGAAAHIAGSGGELADGAMNLLPHDTHPALTFDHTDIAMPVAAHPPLPHAEIPFGSSHLIEPTISSGPSLEGIIHLPLHEQHEALNHLAELAQAQNQPELASNARLVIAGKMDIASVLEESYQKLPLREITKFRLLFGANRH